MELIWTLLLTACFSDTECLYQNVQFFETQDECLLLLTELELMRDGHWKTIDYQCRPLGSQEA
jgi:hypothetical protein|tara:strand:- start:593 stop:781 length:189 start_codon:yes stop_codon:yes gene_type:complete